MYSFLKKKKKYENGAHFCTQWLEKWNWKFVMMALYGVMEEKIWGGGGCEEMRMEMG